MRSPPRSATRRIRRQRSHLGSSACRFLFSFFPYMAGLSTPSQVLEIWKAEFDGSYRAGGCFLLVVHPFCIGRHPRIAMLGELIEYIRGHEDVWFATHLDVAEEWRRLQVEQGTWGAAAGARPGDALAPPIRRRGTERGWVGSAYGRFYGGGRPPLERRKAPPIQ